MKERAVSVVVLMLLLTSMLTSAFIIRPIKAESMTSASQEPPPTEWSNTYGGIGNDNAESLVQTGDGGYAIAGGTFSFGAGNLDFWLVKTDASGTMQWSKTYGGTARDYAYSVVQTVDGGYAIAGYTTSYGAGGCDFWLVKTDSAGNMQWSQTYGGTNDDEAYSVVQTSDGGYALAGYTVSFGAGSYDFLLVKTNSAGTLQWSRTYGGTGVDFAYSLVQTSDGGCAVVGYTTSYGAGDYDVWLVKTDASGTMQWSQTYGGTSFDSAYSVVQTSDGGYALAGSTVSFGAGSNDFWLVKTDSAGNMQWSQTYGGISNDNAHSVVQTVDGGYALAGSNSYGTGTYDFWLVKADASGTMQWSKTYGGTDSDYATSLVQTGDGGYALAGSTWSYGANPGFTYDFWLIKVATEPQTTQKTLTVYSSPSGVAFTANGIDHTTPWSGTFNTGDSVSLEMPFVYSEGDPRYYWDKWSDGVTSHVRTIAMNSDATVTGCYTGPYYELIVASVPMAGIPFTVNGASETTSYSEWLYQGYYTIEMPATYDSYVWQHWLEDGDTNRIRTVTLTYSAMFTAVYAVPDFFVTHLPSTCELQPQTISPGDSTTFSIFVPSLDGFNQEVSLSYSITSNAGYDYEDLTLTLDPPSVTPPPDGAGEATLTVSTGKSLETAIYAITVWGQCEDKSHSTSITLAVANYELFYEIDYMEDHRPREAVLSRIQDYYIRRGISLTFRIDDEVLYDSMLTRDEFWAIEENYNDLGNDLWSESMGDIDEHGVWYSKWKWVLYGSDTDFVPGAAGFCHVPYFDDIWFGLLDRIRNPTESTSGGNYMFISDAIEDSEEEEQVVLMHEMGHSIGILKYHFYVVRLIPETYFRYDEEYDRDATSVMAILNSRNINADPIHYSDAYWALKDIKYYNVGL